MSSYMSFEGNRVRIRSYNRSLVSWALRRGMIFGWAEMGFYGLGRECVFLAAEF